MPREDFVAVQGVCSEPLSAANSLLTPKIQGKNTKKQGNAAHRARIPPYFHSLTDEFPKNRNKEFYEQNRELNQISMEYLATWTR